GAVRRIHRVQRLDGERHRSVARMFENGGDAFLHERSRRAKIPAAFRQSADDQHQTLRGKLRRLLDGAAVLLDGGGEPRTAARGKESAAAKSGHGESRVADPALRLVEPELRDL